MTSLESLAQLTEQARRALLRHVRRPSVLGPASEHFRLWARAYEAKAALADQNTVFATTLLPTTGNVIVPGPGLPQLPAGVQWDVDLTRPNSVTVSVDITGAVGFSALSPAGLPLPLVSASSTGRATATFDALADGLYPVTLTIAGSALAPLLVLVQRAEFRRFRENSRAQAFAFRPRPGAPTGPYRARLARLIAADAAAHTGQAALCASLMDSAAAVETASSPIALYPHG